MKLKTLNSLLNAIYPILSIALLLGAWALLHAEIGNEFVFPSIGSTIKKTGEYLSMPFFWSSFGNTLLRVIISFALSFLFAIAFGTLSHLFTPVKCILSPLISVFRAAPTVALMVILSYLSGPKISPIIVSAAVVFPMLYSAVLSGMDQLSPKLVEMSRAYGVPLKKRVFGLYIPSVLPYILGESGAALSFNVKLTVSAEILAYTYESVGGLLQQANTYIDMAGLFALTVISIIVATVLELLVKLGVYFLNGRASK